ncbi:PspA/IM30 family protein [Oceanobacter sp. 4_MG-2023]|uniref:PspA/IM30 family protein n=1 Tax=Oceanobacter sp. 4_MG-2023 TaxID=3062623 RepID=UPI0027362414|nr:hypothetical protein [Oceanobacter sp. 4_MG-2023]MDP2546545.1 hypothetical protein [Oceanobacter sp. 4_MG-2023]
MSVVVDAGRGAGRGVVGGLLLWVSLVQPLWAGEYYICTDAAGKKLFSQMPCPDHYPSEQAQSYEVPANTGALLSPDAASAGDRQISDDNPGLKNLTANNRRLVLQRQLAQAQKRLSQLSQQQTQALAALQQTRDGIAGTNAANRRQQLDDQINAQKEQYESQRQALTQRIEAYQSELNQLSSER